MLRESLARPTRSPPSKPKRSATTATTPSSPTPSWKFLAPENTGTYFVSATKDETPLSTATSRRARAARPQWLHLDADNVQIHDTNTVAAQPAGRPRGFDRQTKNGTSDHLP
jgi:hypothetical protein